MSQVELRVLTGKQAGSMIPLHAGKFLIGREHDCHLRPNSDLISRHHCAFTVDEFAVQIRDLGSTNGTIVNGEKARGVVVLNPGDRVIVGKLEFELVVDGQPAASGSDTMIQGMDDTTSLSLASGAPAPAQSPALTLNEIEAADFETVADPAPEPAAEEEAPTAVGEFPQVPAPAAAGAPGAPYPPGGVPPWMGPQYPYPGGYPQYPGMPPYGYGYPYPGMPPGSPQGMYPYPQPPQTPQPEPEEEEEDRLQGMRLPDPSTTGAKDPEPGAPGAAGGPAADDPRNAAKNIINSYLQRRPKT